MPEPDKDATWGVIHVDLFPGITQDEADVLMDQIAVIVYGDDESEVCALVHMHTDGGCAISPHCAGGVGRRVVELWDERTAKGEPFLHNQDDVEPLRQILELS